jgi:hypothetical protein
VLSSEATKGWRDRALIDAFAHVVEQPPESKSPSKSQSRAR